MVRYSKRLTVMVGMRVSGWVAGSLMLKHFTKGDVAGHGDAHGDGEPDAFNLLVELVQWTSIQERSLWKMMMVMTI